MGSALRLQWRAVRRDLRARATFKLSHTCVTIVCKHIDVLDIYWGEQDVLDMKMVVLSEIDACVPTRELAVDELADALEGITSAPASPTTLSSVLTQLHTFGKVFAASGGACLTTC
jgi:hypothetical protein